MRITSSCFRSGHTLGKISTGPRALSVKRGLCVGLKAAWLEKYCARSVSAVFRGVQSTRICRQGGEWKAVLVDMPSHALRAGRESS